MRFEVGSTYIMSIVPGWIIGGTITEKDDHSITLKETVYLEAVAEGYSSPGGLAMSKTSAELDKGVTLCHPMPDGTQIAREHIGIACPCQHVTMHSLYYRKEKEALKQKR